MGLTKSQKGTAAIVALLVFSIMALTLASAPARAQTANCSVNQTFSYSYYNPNTLQDNLRLTLVNSTDPTVNFAFRPGVFFFVYGGTNKTISITASANHTTSGIAWVRLSKNGNPLALLEVPFSMSCESAGATSGGNGNAGKGILKILQYIGLGILAILIIGAIILGVLWFIGRDKDTGRESRTAARGEKAQKRADTAADKAAKKSEKNKKVDVDEILKKYDLEEGHQQWGTFQWIMLALFVLFLIAIIIIAATNLNFSLADITARGAANLTNATHP